jgi:glycosyltransferase involved in cell wall biosynthesis
MRIAFLAASGELGGAERSLLDVLAGLRAAEPGWALLVVAPEAGPLVERAAALGAETRVVPYPRRLAAAGDAGARSAGGLLRSLAALGGAAPAVASYAAALRRALAGARPDVVHANGLKMQALAGWAAPRGAAVVWHLHDYPGRRRMMAGVLRRAARRCAAAVAVSASVARDAAAVLGPRVPLRTVWNAVDLARFAPEGAAADLDAMAGVAPPPPGTVRVGLVATMGLWKGHDVFLRAVALLPRDLPVRAYVVGGPIYRTAGSQVEVEALRALAASLGIADRVAFTGFVDDPAPAHRALDVVVHASTQPEPFGLVIAEAMACGRPVVVSLAGGAGEIVDAGTDALGFAPGDAAALAAHLAALARDGAMRGRIGAAARAAAERRFDRARLAAEMADVYRSVAPGA